MKVFTPKEYAKALRSFGSDIAKGKWVENAARDTMTLSDRRIFADGKNSVGGKIGTYSLKPIYIDPDSAPKAVRNIGKTGKKIKSGFYPKGYKQFRSQQGRESAFVNLNLTSELRIDYDNSKAQPRPEKVNNLTYKITLNKQINIDKKKGAENKYGVIFKLTTKEDKQFSKSMDFYYSQLLSKHLGK